MSNSVKLLNYVDLNGNYLKFYTELDSNLSIGDRVFIHGGNYDNTKFTKPENPAYNLYDPFAAGYTILDIDNTNNSNSITLNIPITIGNESFTSAGITSLIINPPTVYLTSPGVNDIKEAYLSKSVFVRGEFNGGIFNSGLFGEFKISENGDSENPVQTNSAKFNNKYINTPAQFTQGTVIGGSIQYGAFTSKYNSNKTGKYQELNQFGSIKDPNDSSRINIVTFANNFNGAGYNIFVSGNIGRIYLNNHYLNITDDKIQFLSLPYELQQAYNAGFSIQLRLKNKYINLGKNDRVFNIDSIVDNSVFIKEINTELSAITTDITQRLFKEIGYFNLEILISDSPIKPNSFDTGRFFDTDILSGSYTNIALQGGKFWNGIFKSGQASSEYSTVIWEGGIFDSTPVTGIATDILVKDIIWINGSWVGASTFRILNIYQNGTSVNIEIDQQYLSHFKIGDEILISYIKSVIGNTYLQSYSDQIGESFLNMNVFPIINILYTADLQERLRFAVVINAVVPSIPLNLQYARISKSNFCKGVWNAGSWQTGYKKGTLTVFTDILNGTRDTLTLSVESIDDFKYWDWVEVANINIVRQITLVVNIDSNTTENRITNVKTNIDTKLRIIDINKYDLTITLDTSFIPNISASDIFIDYELINERSYNVVGTSIWENGDFNSGLIQDNIFKNGNFNSIFSDDLTNTNIQAVWRSGYWKNGNFNNGIYLSGVWLSGVWMEGIMTNSFDAQAENVDNTFALGDSIWYNGTWNNGFWKRGLFKNGIFLNGSIENAGVDSIDFRGGTYLTGLGVFKDKSNGGILNNRSRNDATNQSNSAPSVIYVDGNGWIQLDQPSFYQNDYNIIFQDFDNISPNVFNNQQFNIINRDQYGTRLKIYNGLDDTLDNPNPPEANQLPLVVINNSIDVLELQTGLFWFADRIYQRVIEYNTNTDSLDVIGIILNNPEKEIFAFNRISKMVTSDNSPWVYFLDDFDVITNNISVTEYRWLRVSKDKTQFQIIQQTKNADYINSINNITVSTQTQTKIIVYKDIWIADNFNNATVEEADFLLTTDVSLNFNDILYLRNGQIYSINTNTVNQGVTGFSIANTISYGYMNGIRVKNTEKTSLFLYQGNLIYQVSLNLQNNVFILSSSPTLIYTEDISDIQYPVSTITVDDTLTTIFNTFYFIVNEPSDFGTTQRIKRIYISSLDNSVTTNELNPNNALSYQVNNIRLGYQNARLLYNAASELYPADSTVIGFTDFVSGIAGFNNPNTKLRLLDLVNSTTSYQYWLSDDKSPDPSTIERLIKVNESLPNLYVNSIPVLNFTPLRMVFGPDTNTIYFSSINDEGNQYQIQVTNNISTQPTELISLTNEPILDLVHVLVGTASHVYFTTSTRLLSIGTPFTLTYNTSYRLITGINLSGYTYLYVMLADSLYELAISSIGAITSTLIDTIPGIIDLTCDTFNTGTFDCICLYLLFNDGTVYRMESEIITPGANVWSEFLNKATNDLYMTVNTSFGTNGGEIYRSQQVPDRIIIGGTQDDTFYSVEPQYDSNISQSSNYILVNNGNIITYDAVTNCIYQNNTVTKGRYKQFKENPGSNYNILNIPVRTLDRCGNFNYVLNDTIVQEATNAFTSTVVLSNLVDIAGTDTLLYGLVGVSSPSLYQLFDNTGTVTTALITGTSSSISVNDKKFSSVSYQGKTMFAVSDGTKIKLIDSATASVSYTLHTGTVKDLQFIKNSSTSGISLYFYDNTDTLYVSKNLSASTAGWSYFIPVDIGMTKPINDINENGSVNLSILNGSEVLYNHSENDLVFDEANLISVSSFTDHSNYLVYYTDNTSLVRLEAISGTNGNPTLNRTLISDNLPNISKLVSFKSKAVILANGSVSVKSNSDNFVLPTPEVISNFSSSGLAFEYSVTPIDIAVSNDNILVLYNIYGSSGSSAATSGSSYSFIYGYNSVYGTQGSYTGSYYDFNSNPFGGIALDPFYYGNLTFNNNNVPYVVQINDGVTTIAKTLINPFSQDQDYMLRRLRDKIISNGYTVNLKGQSLDIFRSTGTTASLTATTITGTLDTGTVNISGGTNGTIQLLGSNTGGYDIFNILIGGNTVNTSPIYLNGTSGSLNTINYEVGTIAQVASDTITFTETFENGAVTLYKLSDFTPINGTSSFAFGTNGLYSTSAYSPAQSSIDGFNPGIYGGWVNFILGDESQVILVRTLLDITNSSFTNYTLTYEGTLLVAQTKAGANHSATNGKPFTINRLEEINTGITTNANMASGLVGLASTSGAVFNLQLSSESTSGYVVDNIIELSGAYINYTTTINNNTIQVNALKSGSKFNTANLSVITDWGTINTPVVTGMIADKINYQAIANKIALDTTSIYLYDTSTKINKFSINYSTKLINNSVAASYNVTSVTDMYSTSGSPVVRKYASDPAISVSQEGLFFVNLFDGIQKATPSFTTYTLNSGIATRLKLPGIHTPATSKTIPVGPQPSNNRLEHNLKDLNQYTTNRNFDVDVLINGYKHTNSTTYPFVLDSVNSPYITGRVMYNLYLTGNVSFNVGGTPYTAHLVSSVWDPYISDTSNGLFIGSWDTPKYVDYNYNSKESRFLNGIFQGEWYDGIFEGGLFENFGNGTISTFHEGLVLSDNNNVTFASGRIEPDSRRNDITYVELNLDTNQLILRITALYNLDGQYLEDASPLAKTDLIRIPGLFKEEKININEVRKLSFDPNGIEELLLVCDVPEWLDSTISIATLWTNQNIFIAGLVSSQVPGEDVYINRLYIELFGEQTVTSTFVVNNQLYVTIQCENTLTDPSYVFPVGQKPYIWMNQIFRIIDKKNLNSIKSEIEILLEYPSPEFISASDKLNWVKGALIMDSVYVEYSGTSGISTFLSASQNKAVVYAPQYAQVFRTNFVQTNFPISLTSDTTLTNISFKDIIKTGIVMSSALVVGEDIMIENSDITSVNNYTLRGAVNPSNPVLSGKLNNVIFLSGETDLDFYTGAWLNLDRYGFSNGTSKFKSVTYNQYIPASGTYVATTLQSSFFGENYLLLNNRVSFTNNTLTLTIPSANDLLWNVNDYITLRGFSGVNSYLLGSSRSRVFRITNYSYDPFGLLATVQITLPKAVNVVIDSEEITLFSDQPLTITGDQDITNYTLISDTDTLPFTYTLSTAYLSNNVWNGGDFDGLIFNGIWNGGNFRNGAFGSTSGATAQWFSDTESYYWGGLTELVKTTNDTNYTITIDLTGKPFLTGDLVYVRFNDYLREDSFYAIVDMNKKVNGFTLNNFTVGEYGVNIIRYKTNNTLFLNQNLSLGPESDITLHTAASNSFGTNGGWTETETFVVTPNTEDAQWDINSVSRDSIFYNGVFMSDIFRSGVMMAGHNNSSLKLIWKYGVNEGATLYNTLWIGGFNNGGVHYNTEWLRGRWSNGEWRSGSWFSFDQNLNYNLPYSIWTGGVWYSRNTANYLPNGQSYNTGNNSLITNNYQLATESSVWYGGIWESPVVTDINGNLKTYTWDSDFTQQFGVQISNTINDEALLLPKVSSLWLGGQWYRGEFRGGIFYGGIWHSKSLQNEDKYFSIDVASDFNLVSNMFTGNLTFTISNNGVPFYSQVINSLPLGSSTINNGISTILKNVSTAFKSNLYPVTYTSDLDSNGIAVNGKLIFQNKNLTDSWSAVYNTAASGEAILLNNYVIDSYDVTQSKFKGGKFINAVWLGGIVDDVTDPNEIIFGDCIGDNVQLISDDSGFNNESVSFNESIISNTQTITGINLFNNQTSISSIWKSLKAVPLNSIYSAVWTRGIWKNGIFKHSSWYNLATDIFVDNYYVSKFNYQSKFRKGLFYGSVWDGGLWVASNGKFVQNGIVISDNLISTFSESRWKKGYWTTDDTHTTIVANAGDETEVTNSTFWRSVWDCGVFEGGVFDLSVWRSGYVVNDIPTISMAATSGTAGTSGSNQVYLQYQRNKLTIEYDLDNIYGTSGTNGTSGESNTRSYDVLSVMDNMKLLSPTNIVSNYYNQMLGYNWSFNVTDNTGTRNIAQSATINVDNQKFNGTYGTAGITSISLTTQDLSLLNPYRFTGNVDNFASIWINGIMRGSIWHGGVWMRGMFLHKETPNKDFFNQKPINDIGLVNTSYQEFNLGFWFRGIWLAGYFGYYNDTQVEISNDWNTYLNSYNNPRNRSLYMSMDPFTITSDMDPTSISGYRVATTLSNIYNHISTSSIFTRATNKLSTGRGFHSVFNGHMLGGSILDNDTKMDRKILISSFAIIGNVYVSGSSTSGNTVDPGAALNFKLRNATTIDNSTQLPLPLDYNQLSNKYNYYNTIPSINLVSNINYGNSFNYTFRHNNSKYGDGTLSTDLPSLAQGAIEHFHKTELIGEPFHSTSGVVDYSSATTISTIDYVQNVANNDLILLITLNNYDLTTGIVNEFTITPNPKTGSGSLTINSGIDPNGLIQQTSYIYNGSNIITNSTTMFVAKVNKPTTSNLIIGTSYFIAIQLS
jgi:hypothetical protein